MKPRKLARRLRRLTENLVPGRRALRDAAIVSFPKSGRTWLRFMLDSVHVPVDFSHAGSDNRLGLTYDEVASRIDQWADRRIAFLHRDPRDTLVSCFFQATKRVETDKDVPATISLFLRDPRYGIEKIARFNLLWIKSSGRFRDFASFAYEDMHGSPRQELSRLFLFLTGRKPTERIIDKAVKAGRFDNMRKVEEGLKGRYDPKSRLGGGSGDADGSKVRRGKVGGWTDYLDADDVAFVDGVLDRLDYWARISGTSGQSFATAD